MAQIYCTRAKTFVGEHEGAERVLSIGISAGRPTPVPDWVKNTQTYKHGIKDKSIVDLTPPAPVAAHIPAIAEDEPQSIESEKADGEPNEESAPEKPAKAKNAGKAMGLKAS